MTSTQATVTVISQNVIQVATIGLRGPVGPSGPAAPTLMGSVYLQNATNLSFPLVSSARYPFTIQGLYNLVCASGTIMVTISKNGVPVGGLTNIAVNQTPQDVLATAGNQLVIGNRVTLDLSGGTLAQGLEFTLQAQMNNS